MRSRDKRSGFALGLAALTLCAVLGGPAVADDLGPGPAAEVPSDGTLDTYPSVGPTEAPQVDPRPRQARRPRPKHLARPPASSATPLAILPSSQEPTGSIPAGAAPAETRPKAAAETKPKAVAKTTDRHVTLKGTPPKAAMPKHPLTAGFITPLRPPLPPKIERPAPVKPASAPVTAPDPTPIPVQAAAPPAQSIASIPAGNPVRARADPRPEPGPPVAFPIVARPDSGEALTQIAPVALRPAAAGDAQDVAPDQTPTLAAGSSQPAGPAAPWTSTDQALANNSRTQVLGELRKEQSRYADEALRQLREERQEGF